MTIVNTVIGIAVLVWVVYQQLRTRPLNARRIRLAAILGVVGLFQIHSAASGHPVPASAWGLLLGGLVVGGAIGVWRAYTMRMWVEGDRTMVRGTWVTALLWLVSVAVHVGLDLLAPSPVTTGSASILLFVAVTLGAQALALTQRARAVEPAEPQRV